MKDDNIPYALILLGVLAGLFAGIAFPSVYALVLGIAAGGLTSLGVGLAQANAYSQGQEDGEGEEE